MPRCEVVIVGGGQAGLATSYCLRQRGIDHVILDRGELGDSWRNRWDSLCLVTPNWQCRLPGHRYDGADPHGFMHRDEIVAYLERYASKFSPPLRGGVEVSGVRCDGDLFVLSTSEGDWVATSVVIAAGAFQHAQIPAFASHVDPGIQQLHSRDYRNHERLAPGAVLVVGSGQSGCQIAEDLLRAGRTVHLAVGSTGRVQRRYRGRDVLEWAVELGRYAVTVDDHPSGRAVRGAPHPHLSGRDGGRTIDLRELALRGVHLHGHLDGVDGTVVRFTPNLRERLDAADAFCRAGLAQIDAMIVARGLPAEPPDPVVHDWQPGEETGALDLPSANVTTILWATGYRQDFSWIDAPVFDARGYPRGERGVSELPGLYFVGLHWLHTFGSGLFYGVGSDAEHVVAHLATWRGGR